MACRFLSLALSLSLGLTAPVVALSQSAAFVSLPQFLASVSSARYSDYSSSPLAAVESESEFETMRAHLLAQYEGVTATHSFMIDSQYVDCIPVMQQPSVRRLGLSALAVPNWPGSSVVGNYGEQLSFGPLQWTLSGGNWWLCHGASTPTESCNIGYYPGTIYNGGQRSRYATQLQFGGEVDSPYGAPGFSPMGSGELASGSFAAFQWNTAYLSSPTQQLLVNAVPTTLSLVNCNTNSSCFTLACANSTCSSFYFGGPGGPSCP